MLSAASSGTHSPGTSLALLGQGFVPPGNGVTMLQNPKPPAVHSGRWSAVLVVLAKRVLEHLRLHPLGHTEANPPTPCPRVGAERGPGHAPRGV